MQYHLMNKDKCVAEFKQISLEGTVGYRLIRVVEKLPYGFTNITKWLHGRQAAKYRQHIKNLMHECGCDTIDGFIRVIHCTSINDTFWVKQEHENIAWKDVSLYKNEFNDTIARLAFEGVGLYGERFSSTTPEFGTSGAYSKCITKDNNGIMYMYKRGTEGYANAGLEPYCEALSSELYSIITHDSVAYSLCTLHDRVASRCKIFTNEDSGLAPYGYVGEDYDIPGCLQFYGKYASADKFRAMLVADAVCFNEDRHAGNHGVIYNTDTLEIKEMAPIYDNNIALLPYAIAYDFDNINSYMEEHNTRLGLDWVSDARNLLTSELRSILINLQGYSFDFKGDEKFTKERVKVIESLVNQQIKRILGKGPIIGFTGIRAWEDGKHLGSTTKARYNGGVKD